MTARLSGVIAAIPTPFTDKNEPDAGAFVAFAGHLLANGCDALNVLGTTGEATSLPVAARKALMSAAGANLPKDRLMVGTGTAALADTVELTRHAGELGYAGALLLPPFYYKGVPDEGIIATFRMVAEATRDTAISLYLYNFPAMTGIVYTRPLVERLMEAVPGRIVGLKDSSGDMAYAADLAAIDGFDVFPSNEASLLQARDGLYAGCISATANLNADLCARAWREGDAEALDRAVAIRARVAGPSLIAGVKAVVAARSGHDGYRYVLPPLIELGAEERGAVLEDVDAIRNRRLAAV